jgi:hypothetical protein
LAAAAGFVGLADTSRPRRGAIGTGWCLPQPCRRRWLNAWVVHARAARVRTPEPLFDADV